MAHDLDRLDSFTLVPMLEATKLPRVSITPDVVTKVRNGLQLPPEVVGVPPENYERFLMLDASENLVGIGHVEGNKTIYDRVFVT
jgi:hypothetical protein